MYHKRVIIVPYKFGSKGAKNLQEGLQAAVDIPILLVSKKSTKYQPRWTDYVINWGCSADWPWINMTDKHANQTVVNKLDFFQQVGAAKIVWPNCPVNIPEWTTDWEVANSWFGNKWDVVEENEHKSPLVVCRKILNGHSGEGITIYDAAGSGIGEVTPDFKTYPLYVLYKKKRHEYRVHFFKDGHTYTVIDITQKKKRKGFENVNTKIRNHQNGWVYAREDIFKPEDLITQALNAAFVSNLDFGAVDLIWNEHENKCYVLEVNSAPGIEGTTLQQYITAFAKDIKNV
jgi:hypothetical protein